METAITFFEEYRAMFGIAHLIGVVFGVGGATINDVLFFRFLKDLKISHFESSILKTLSQVIWAGLIILIVSGIGLYLPRMERLNESSKFLTKMVVVAVIALNGVALNTFISPRLKHISFEQKHEHVPGELRRLRRIAFALGSISFVSWYVALILGALRNLSYSVTTLLIIYSGILCVAIIGSQIFEHLISKRVLRP